MSDNFKMNTNRYSDNELHLMSYQELRRLSILMQLPANIKKKYMISMIKAHQNGDGCTKLAIANKIMEERKVKRLINKKKTSKSYKSDSPNNSQEVPESLSVSTKHEFETRFSYVTHYTTKNEINSGLSRIIKQETEVSRRNRSVLQQPRKPTRKLSAVGRTEIMLPRNHSLTTPVRLMPQCERGYPPPTDYEPVSGLANAKTHYQNVNSYNYHFHGEFSNSTMPTSTQDSYRNEPYWHTREVYNNSLMPILSSLLAPNSASPNSSGYASQYNSVNSGKESTSFQGVYEKYIKSNSMIESQTFQSSDSSTVINNNHQLNDTNNCNIARGSYVITKSDVDFEITSALNQINYQHYNRRDEGVTRNLNGNQSCFVDFFVPRNGEPLSPQMVHVTNVKDLSQYSGGYYRADDKSMIPVCHHPFESSSVISYRTTEIVEANGNVHESAPTMAVAEYEPNYQEGNWEELENGIHRSREKENFDNYLPHQPQESFLSEISDNSTDYSAGAESNEMSVECRGRIENMKNFPRCRYVLGHNKYPETFGDPDRASMSLPSFLNTFSTSELQNKGYSVCKNSFTGTTETHLNPIMTCMHGSQTSSHSRYVNNSESQMQRQWLQSYSDSQVPFSSETAAYSSWNEFSNEMDNEVIMQHNGHDVQVVKCRTHGCHYLYSVLNPCS